MFITQLSNFPPFNHRIVHFFLSAWAQPAMVGYKEGDPAGTGLGQFLKTPKFKKCSFLFKMSLQLQRAISARL